MDLDDPPCPSYPILILVPCLPPPHPISISHPISPIPTPPPSHPSPLYSPTTLFTRSSFNTLFLPSQPITRSGPQSSLLSLTGTIYAPRR
ncbi:ORF156 [White spot syndrome virus]|uniref:ORF156 n=1 Tax=White spot syndrome virus TaxID=342409 RepID=A0A2D3I5S4_9VIRU|nr:ORF156 [White spot syndrome virus]